MVRMNKLVAAVLVCMMLLGIANTAGAAYSDIPQKADYREAVDFLSGIGVVKGYDDGTYQPDESVTRAEFASMIMRISGMEDTIDTIADPFTFSDVDPNYWAAGVIEAANKMGIIKGMRDGQFMPEEKVTYEQAIKMIVNVLGYEVYANQKGGYPTGFLVVAADIGITKDTEGKTGEALNRATMAKLLYRALDIDIMTQTGYGNDKNYTVSKGKTLLNEKMEIYKIKGQITGNNATRLRSKSTLKENEIEIEDEKFIIEDKSISNMLGYYVEAYYKQDINDQDHRSIIYIKSDPGRNTVVNIKANDIQGYSNQTLSYYEGDKNNEKLRKLNISTVGAILYNEVALTDNDEYRDSLFLPDSGGLECIDTDNDEKYDVIKITNYQNYVVNSINKEDGIVSDRYGASNLILKTSDPELFISLKDTVENKVLLNDLKPWDVLSVRTSLDGKSIHVVASGEAIQGTVMEIFSERNRTYVKVEGEIFTLAKNVDGKINLGVGNTGTYYLDAQGEIAAVQLGDESGMILGYLVDAEVPNKGVERIIKFKIFDQTGQMIYAEGAKEIRIDNQLYSDHMQILASFKEGSEIKKSRSLIRFSLDNDDQVSEIDTEDMGTNESANTLRVTYPVDSGGKHLDVAPAMQYKATPASFGGNVSINDKVKIFIIPENLKADQLFRVEGKSYLGNDTTYTINAYSLKENGLFDDVLVVYQKSGEDASTRDPIVVVDKITTSLNEDGEPTEKLYGMQDGKDVSFIADKGYSWNANYIISGDNIIIHKNSRGQVDNATRLYDYKNKAADSDYAGAFNDEFRIVCCNVYDKEDNLIKVKVLNSFEKHTLLSSSKIYIYDSELPKDDHIRLGSVNDLQGANYFRDSYSKIVMYTRYAEIKAIVIYK